MIYYIEIKDYKEYEYLLKYKEVVDNDRKVKFDSYYNKEDKINCILSSLIINKYCKDNNINNFKLCLDKNKKPYDYNNNFCFNISHTDKMVVVAFNKYAVGVDAEKIETYTAAQLNYCLNEVEQSKYDMNNDLFTKIWTIKESYVKQSGVGLLSTFNNINVNYLEDNNKILNLYINSYKVNNHYISVCCEKNISDIRKLNISELIND